MGQGCTCDKYIDEYGYGNCRLTYKGQVGCYVEEPTACSDTTQYNGHVFSISEACSETGADNDLGIMQRLKDFFLLFIC